MKQTSLSEFEIPAQPVKSFFVDMLTRDIELDDTILDLLDNCVDGIVRNKPTGDNPYKGYWAKIEITSDYFSITDNCGGIPKHLLRYAFMMGPAEGKPKEEGTVGVYGIGMKRAIFKLGKSAQITTRNQNMQYDIEISRKWIEAEDFKDLSVKPSKTSEENGTKIVVSDLNDDIRRQFSKGLEDFLSTFSFKVSTNFAYIIEKGFEITINNSVIKPKTTNLKFYQRFKDDSTISPYIFKTSMNGVDVFLTVGLTRSFLSTSEIEKEEQSAGSSLDEAGWTVICNDRVVLENNRDKLTGWGENNVPRYHTQFRIIAGIAEFRAADPSDLPTTTTKRGIRPDHPVYREIKKKMCEGTKIFTDFTNQWKKSGKTIDQQIDETPRSSLNEIRKATQTISILTPTTFESVKAEEHVPILPQPDKDSPISTKQKISFTKETSEIEAVANYLKLKKWKPKTVGEKCFDLIYKEI